MVNVIGHCVDEPLFSADIVLDFVYATMILNDEHKQKRHIRGSATIGVMSGECYRPLC